MDRVRDNSHAFCLRLLQQMCLLVNNDVLNDVQIMIDAIVFGGVSECVLCRTWDLNSVLHPCQQALQLQRR